MKRSKRVKKDFILLLLSDKYQNKDLQNGSLIFVDYFLERVTENLAQQKSIINTWKIHGVTKQA